MVQRAACRMREASLRLDVAVNQFTTVWHSPALKLLTYQEI
jgi:hypothetical protein